MSLRLAAPTSGLLAAAFAAWAYLLQADRVVEVIPQRLVSGAYDLILLAVCVCFGWLLHRLSRLPGRSGGGPLVLRPWPTTRLLSIAAAALVWVNVFDYLLKLAIGYRYRKVMPLFALEQEGNLPTLFATALLLACALLLALVARATPRENRDRGAWIGLALLFAFLALDEFAVLHERLAPVGRTLLSGSGAFAREWLVVYGLLLLPLTLLFLPFMRRLPPSTRRTWLIAAVLFLGGAAGLELVAGWHDQRVGEFTVGRALLNIAKEALELAGVLVFLYGLLEHIRGTIGSLGVVDGSST